MILHRVLLVCQVILLNSRSNQPRSSPDFHTHPSRSDDSIVVCFLFLRLDPQPGVERCCAIRPEYMCCAPCPQSAFDGSRVKEKRRVWSEKRKSRTSPTRAHTRIPAQKRLRLKTTERVQVSPSAARAEGVDSAVRTIRRYSSRPTTDHCARNKNRMILVASRGRGIFTACRVRGIRLYGLQSSTFTPLSTHFPTLYIEALMQHQDRNFSPLKRRRT